VFFLPRRRFLFSGAQGTFRSSTPLPAAGVPKVPLSFRAAGLASSFSLSTLTLLPLLLVRLFFGIFAVLLRPSTLLDWSGVTTEDALDFRLLLDDGGVDGV